MYHKYIVNQKINEDCKIKVNFITDEYLNWTYESFFGPTNKTDSPIFPIIVNNEVLIKEKEPGRETICKRLNDGIIAFSDDYSVPEGFLICVTSPVGYEPKIIKLKNKPTFNNNNFNNVIPAHFEVKSNLVTNQTSVLMHVLSRAYFGIYIEFTRIEGKVKNYKNYWYDNPYDLSLSLVHKELSIINAKEIEMLHPNLPSHVIEEFTKIINELIKELKNNENEYNHSNYSAKNKFLDIAPKILGTGSSVVTLLDSYKNAGVLGEFLTFLFKLFENPPLL